MNLAATIANMKAAGMAPDAIVTAVECIVLANSGRSYEDTARPPLKPYKPRHDFYGPLVPRLPERDWLMLWGEVCRRDGKICAYCETEDGPWCVDHIVPLSRGGSNGMHNLTMCCIPCNSSKSDRLLSEWRGRFR